MSPTPILDWFKGHPERWCQHVLHRFCASDGQEQCCLEGATFKFYGDNEGYRRRVLRRIEAVVAMSAVAYNDAFDREHKDIVRILELAQV